MVAPREGDDIEASRVSLSSATFTDVDADAGSEKRRGGVKDEEKAVAVSAGEQELGSQQQPAGKEAGHSVNDVSAVPNGGTKAWLQVLGAFFLFFNSWGITNTFGTYQTYYKTGLLASSTPSAISWIGSIQAFLLMLVGALTGPIYDAGYFRHLLVVGSFLIVFGLMMLSLCTVYWQVLLAQAFCVGIGTGCLFVPSVAILSTYFTTRLATAMGLAASGSSLGGVLYPIILHRLIGRIGFPWTTRVIAFIALATLLIPNLCMRVRVLPSSRRAMLDLPAWREPPYTLFVLGGIVGFLGLYTPFFYISSYATSRDIVSPDLAFYILAILNAASCAGRIVPNVLADRTGPFNIIVPCAAITGTLTLCLIPVTHTAPLIVVAILYGFFSGTFVSLPPTVLVHLAPERSKIGTRMGMAFAAIACGILVGTPVAGVILNAVGFKYVWVFGGVTTIAGSCFMFAARGLKHGWKLKQWA
ncbi:uncharacterized protein K452DRAFT_284346 [Aplosporella prunicola CBS 121167]|uniref:Major facilitator superfamily (MFS) profile domain-containing protein n=1 Tax=Aplosporella prunicola CBS 121167 TaxID=1176127 RepID=A0A6A6BQU8_9PEZI|nr:uncharacterized protein K452DRAFT_284346 [Aplosporella prunicola CBS 121167]KAF2144961.1 hypothetical protein K452DRAFT_284346 [Aplosporella prunicola CBS 121167]